MEYIFRSWQKKEFKVKKNHINNKTKPRWLTNGYVKLNHKLPYNSTMLHFFLFIIPTILKLVETVMPTHWQGFPQIVESRFIVSIYYFIPSFHCSLRLRSNFCCGSCRWRCSLPYVHMWWVGKIIGAHMGMTLSVIQALPTCFVSSM